MLAIVGASGKLGYATLTSLLEHNLLPASHIICTTSSPSGESKLRALQRTHPFHIRHATWDDPSTLAPALQDCTNLFLISSPAIHKDFNEAPPGSGREEDHYALLTAAKEAGIEHVYYTSLAFANPSKSRVMKAHERTEAYLAEHWEGRHTIIREGLYSESWPLYLGHYDLAGDAEREEVVVAGDGKVNWTSIPDLGLANALILADPVEKWRGRTFYLCQREAWTLGEVAGMVGRARGKEVRLRVVGREEHERFYVRERGMERDMVEWWSRSYDALRDGECEIDDPTLEELLARKGAKPTPMEEKVGEML